MSANIDSTGQRRGLGVFAYVIGGLSFFPMLGLLFGVAASIWGISARRRGGMTLALIGAAGIGFNVLAYGGLYYVGFVQRGGLYDDLRAKMAQNNLNALVQSVEIYKLGHGEYPDSLETLKSSLKEGSFESIYVNDPRILATGAGNAYFYYERVGAEHYYLRGVAADGKPFSPGALVPQIGVTGGKFGLLTDSPAKTP
jgi:Type II secretion system (T2SS), protein G